MPFPNKGFSLPAMTPTAIYSRHNALPVWLIPHQDIWKESSGKDEEDGLPNFREAIILKIENHEI